MSKLSGLKRVLVLYGLVERMHLSESQMALGAVLEVDSAVLFEAQSRQILLDQGREALQLGDTSERKLAELGSQVCTIRMLRLADMKVRRQQISEQSIFEHRQSRLKKQQVERVLERAVSLTGIEEGRRTQAASDDRYGSRRGWMLAQATREQALRSSHQSRARFGT